jgi:hypothetical protein
MGESRESREGESRIGTPRHIGPVRITPLPSGIALYFPPLRAAASALMLAFFGVACSIIALAAMAGLVRSGDTEAASMLAFAFAGVFALPLFALGQVFIAVALWTAANSLQVEITDAGLTTVRRWFGYVVARRSAGSADVNAVESRLDAKYMGAFGALRYYRLFARSRLLPGGVLIADSLRGAELTEEIRQLVIEHLRLPALAAAGVQAHIAQEEVHE